MLLIVSPFNSPGPPYAKNMYSQEYHQPTRDHGHRHGHRHRYRQPHACLMPASCLPHACLMLASCHPGLKPFGQNSTKRSHPLMRCMTPPPSLDLDPEATLPKWCQHQAGKVANHASVCSPPPPPPPPLPPGARLAITPAFPVLLPGPNRICPFLLRGEKCLQVAEI